MAASTDFNYDDVLSLKRAKILDRRRRTYLGSTELLISYGEVASAQKEECIKWLYDNRRIITDPVVGFNTLTGKWVCTDTRYDDDKKQIIQSFFDVMQSAPIAESTTVWRLIESPLENSGAQNVVLEASYVDPLYLQTVLEDVTSDPYDGSINTINAGVLSGKWYNVKRIADTDQDTGLTRVMWLLRKHNNDDMIFTWMGNEVERQAEFIKLHCPPDGIPTFKTTYYFDTSGNFYVSTDATNYTAKNGVAATGVLPSDAKLLGDNPAGRVIINYDANPDKVTGEVDIRVMLSWFTDDTEKGIIYRGRYGEVMTVVDLEDVTATRRDAFVAYTYLDEDGNWYYSEDATNYTAMNGSAASGVLPASAKDLDDLTTAGYRIRLRTPQDKRTQLYSVMLECMRMVSDTRMSYIGDSDSRITYKPMGRASVVMDQAYNITKAEIDTAMAYYNSAPADGTQRQVPQPRKDPDTGLYSYEAIEITMTKLAASFRIGPEVIYIGEDYDKEPTTDIALFNADNPEAVGVLPESDNYYLIGASWTGSAWTCLIDSSSSIFGGPEHNPQNNTWSWRIRHVTAQEESVGSADPENDTSDYLFQYGDAHNFERYVVTRTGQTITLGTLSFLSYFEDVPANTFGVHAALPNRRKVTPIIRNARVMDGKLDYELWERVQTPDINDDDEWYYMGASESLDRVKDNLVSETIRSDGLTYPGGSFEYSSFYAIMQGSPGMVGDGDADGKLSVAELAASSLDGTIPVLARLQIASKQRRTVERSRRFFMERPTDSDLDSIIDEGTTSVKDAWDAVINEQTAGVAPSASSAKTFDIVRVGDQYAIERLVVRIDDEIYKDADAMDHFFDSAGNSMCGMSILPIHADGSYASVYTDETEA